MASKLKCASGPEIRGTTCVIVCELGGPGWVPGFQQTSLQSQVKQLCYVDLHGPHGSRVHLNRCTRTCRPHASSERNPAACTPRTVLSSRIKRSSTIHHLPPVDTNQFLNLNVLAFFSRRPYFNIQHLRGKPSPGRRAAASLGHRHHLDVSCPVPRNDLWLPNGR